MRNIECMHLLAEARTWLRAGPKRAVALTLLSPEPEKPDLVQIDVVAPVDGLDYAGTATGENYLETFDLAVQDLYGAAATERRSPAESGEIPICVIHEPLIRYRA